MAAGTTATAGAGAAGGQPGHARGDDASTGATRGGTDQGAGAAAGAAASGSPSGGPAAAAADAVAAAARAMRAAAAELQAAAVAYNRLDVAVGDAALSTARVQAAAMTLMAIRPHKLTPAACELLRERAGWRRLATAVAAAADDHAAAERAINAAADDAAVAAAALAHARTASMVDFLQGTAGGGGLGTAAGISTGYHIRMAAVAAADVARKAATARALTGGRMPRVRRWAVVASPLLDALNVAVDNRTADLLIRHGIRGAAAGAAAAGAQVGAAADWAAARSAVMAADGARVAERLAGVEAELLHELRRHRVDSVQL
ncbi:hypothetical protein I4F81_001803 [Pyropia yezoensis]|uniref:Uncharacterized protein n=1 Tax=Pyropia yezoensis TaxID=2788 RepID=A0ACC3BNY6_PYRYE|nr:hypothetical protein I4F81_001803 [Neopyropia yezoensis]